MQKEIKKSPEHEADANEPRFKGYTIEELRYQRALIALRKDFVKENLIHSIQELKPKRKKSEPKNPVWGLAGSVASKVFANMNTLDYVLMGIQLFGTAKKGFRMLRGKKK